MNALRTPVRRVLSVGNDSTLLGIRELLLTGGGYGVCSVPDWNVTEEMDLCGFDVVLVCHTIPRERAVKISRIVRSRNHDLQTVRLTYLEGDEGSGFHAAWDLSMGPGRFLQQLATLLGSEGVSRRGFTDEPGPQSSGMLRKAQVSAGRVPVPGQVR